LLLGFVLKIFSEDSFITKWEYSSMLYKNPRGIGCYLCHGINAKGKIIAFYKHKGKKRVLKAPDITKIPFKRFYKVLSSNKNLGIMPAYFLTRKEIKALYFYVKKVKE